MKAKDFFFFLKIPRVIDESPLHLKASTHLQYKECRNCSILYLAGCAEHLC